MVIIIIILIMIRMVIVIINNNNSNSLIIMIMLLQMIKMFMMFIMMFVKIMMILMTILSFPLSRCIIGYNLKIKMKGRVTRDEDSGSDWDSMSEAEPPKILVKQGIAQLLSMGFGLCMEL